MTTIDAGPVRGATVRPLIVLPSDPFGDQIGGIKTFVLDFVRFSPADFATEMVACSSDPAARPLGMWQTIEVAGRSVRYLPILATPDVHRRPIVPRSLWFAARTMFHRNARHTRGKVLQFHHPGSPAGYLTTSAPKILVVHLNAADIDRGLGESRWTTFPGMLHRYEDVTLPRIDRIFTVNEAGARFYRERHPAIADRVTYLPTFVDPDAFAPYPEPVRRAARRALLERIGRPADGDDRLVLSIGRLERQKDPLLLIEAFAIAAAGDARLRLVVVGEGGLRKDAERRARELGIADLVHWLGFQAHDAMRDLMNGADLFVLSSAFEGMPITVLEALACGLPVVSTDVGGVATVVHDRQDGRLVAEREPAALAEAIGWVAERPRDAFLEACRAAIAPYAPQQVLAPFYDAHRELQARGPR